MGSLLQARPEGYEFEPRFDMWCAVALAHAESGTYERHANEHIPQAVIIWLYDGDYVKSGRDQTNESYILLTERGEALLTALLGGKPEWPNA